MKKLLIVLGFLLVFSIANAEVYLLINKTTKEVKDMSPENDAVIETGYEKIILSGKLEDYAFTDNPTNYFYKSGKFIKNIDKIDKQEQEKIKQEERIVAKKALKEKLKTISLEKTVGTDGLLEIGKKLDKAIDAVNDLLKVQE